MDEGSPPQRFTGRLAQPPRRQLQKLKNLKFGARATVPGGRRAYSFKVSARELHHNDPPCEKTL
jgi:hypothetical protein